MKQLTCRHWRIRHFEIGIPHTHPRRGISPFQETVREKTMRLGTGIENQNILSRKQLVDPHIPTCAHKSGQALVAYRRNGQLECA